MAINKIRIGSRGSDLALWQANFVKNEIESKLKVPSEIIIIKTKGDQIQNVSFDKMEGKGFFTKEIEDALLNNEVDLAIHSHKDLPSVQPEGLTIAAVSYRENVSDLLLIHPDSYDRNSMYGLPVNAKLGTSSYRRSTQITAHRSDLNITALRGNVPTRLDKLVNKEYDGIILASAGINRLNLDLKGMIAVELDPKNFIPAPAQGVLALQCHENNKELRRLLQSLHHDDVQELIRVERSILRSFDGGCQIALGVFTKKDNNKMLCRAAWSPDLKSVPYYIFHKNSNASELSKQCYDYLKNADKVLKKRKIYTTKVNGDWPLLEKFSEDYSYNFEFNTHVDITHTILKDSDLTSDNIIVTSKNVVASLSQISKSKIDSLRFFAVGESTANELKKITDSEIIISPHASQKEMADWLRNEFKNEKFLFLSGNLASNHFEAELLNVKRLNVYETSILKQNTETIKKINNSTDLLFTSTSNFKAIESEDINWFNKRLYTLGEQTASYIRSKVSIEPIILEEQSPACFISELIKTG